MAKYQYIYFMTGLSKQFTGGKKILEDIHLQFYPDAKIGIVGVNGAGKSTLLKIMAGVAPQDRFEDFAEQKLGFANLDSLVCHSFGLALGPEMEREMDFHLGFCSIDAAGV